jgi:hypothetical protein
VDKTCTTLKEAFVLKGDGTINLDCFVPESYYYKVEFGRCVTTGVATDFKVGYDAGVVANRYTC